MSASMISLMIITETVGDVTILSTPGHRYKRKGFVIIGIPIDLMIEDVSTKVKEARIYV